MGQIQKCYGQMDGQTDGQTKGIPIIPLPLHGRGLIVISWVVMVQLKYIIYEVVIPFE